MQIKILLRALKVAFLTGVLFFASSVSAIEYGMLGGKPANPDANVENSSSWFLYNLKPGEAKEDALTVMNLFSEALDVMIYAADSIPSSSGGFALKQFSEPNEEVGAWVKFYPADPPAVFAGVFEKQNKSVLAFCRLASAELQKEYGKTVLSDDQLTEKEKWCQGESFVEKKMAGKENANVRFVFAVPEKADVGEHTGGILIQKKGVDDQTTQTGSAVKLTTRVGVRIYETVPGAIVRKLSLDDFRVVKNFSEFGFGDWFGEKKPKEYLVQSQLSNSGNVSVDHQNNIVIQDLLFHKRDQVVERKFQVLKQDKFVGNLSWEKPLFGLYAFQAQIKYTNSAGQEEEILSAPVKLWVIPWREMTLVVLLVLLILGVYLGWRAYNRKKYGGIGWVPYAVKKADTLAKLAEKFQVDWKVLAKTNKIEAPYLLEAGSQILVPPIFGTSGDLTESLKVEENPEIIPESEKTEEVLAVPETKPKRGRKPKVAAVNEAPVAEKAPVVKKTVRTREKKDVLVAELFAKDRKIAAQSEEKKPWDRRILWGIGIIVAVGVAVAAGLVVWKEVGAPAANPSVEQVATPSMTEKTPTDSAPKVEEKVDAAAMTLKVLNEGAPAGTAGKIKDLLVAKGYLKAEAGNGEKEEATGSIVACSADRFKKEAEWIREVLIGKGILAELKLAETAEEKSADVVIILGK